MTTRACPCGTPITERNRTGRCRSCSSRRTNNGWSEAELETLRDLYPSMGWNAPIPGRSKYAIRDKACELGVARVRTKTEPTAPTNARDGYDRKQGARYQQHRARNVAKARELLEAGVKPGEAKQGHMRLAMVAVSEVVAEEKRRDCPVQQAMTELRRHFRCVVPMSCTDFGGPSNLYLIGQAKNVREADMLAMAAKYAAKRRAAA